MIIEDNLTTSRMLSLFLDDAGYSVECVNNGKQALQVFSDESFDLLVLDLMLPDLDGISICQKIRGTSSVPIVMLTARSTEDDIVRGLEAGADDYVCKPFGSRELLARIRCCMRSRRKDNNPSGAVRIKVGRIELCIERRRVWVNNKPVKLTKSEFVILELLMKNTGRVFTRDQLLRKAFGPNYDGFERSIDTHIWNLRKKIGEPKGQPRYVQSEPGVGYRMNDPYEK